VLRVAHEYSIDAAQRLVYIRMWGKITRAEVMVTRSEVANDARLRPEFSELIDLTGTTSVSAITADDVRDLASVELDSVARRAFVAPDPVAFGLARMYGSLREMKNAPDEVAVFHKIEDARDWLGLGQSI
jgi:hypothetical protein